MRDRKAGAQRLDQALQRYLDKQGFAARVEQSQVLQEWPSLVGEQIAAVTSPLAITQDGTLFVGVKTHAWMTELSMLERDLLSAVNKRIPDSPIRQIRFQLAR